jgi:hypothetical protein
MSKQLLNKKLLAGFVVNWGGGGLKKSWRIEGFKVQDSAVQAFKNELMIGS